MPYTQILSLALIVFSIVGAAILLAITAVTVQRYWGSTTGSFRWRLRNIRLRQVSAIACLFFLAMTASYAVLKEAWAILYFVIALKIGTWWLRLIINERI